jgi:hypothetical protein
VGSPTIQGEYESNNDGHYRDNDDEGEESDDEDMDNDNEGEESDDEGMDNDDEGEEGEDNDDDDMNGESDDDGEDTDDDIDNDDEGEEGEDNDDDDMNGESDDDDSAGDVRSNSGTTRAASGAASTESLRSASNNCQTFSQTGYTICDDSSARFLSAFHPVLWLTKYWLSHLLTL